MRITIVAFGTRGDVQPLIALGLGLRASGHSVRMATQTKFCDIAARYDLECVPIEADVRLPADEKTKTGLQSPLTISRLAHEYMNVVLAGTWEACKDAEALIFSDWARIPSIHIAEKLGVPAFMSFIHPQQMKFLYRETQVFGPASAWLTSRVSKQILWWLALKGPINRWRTKILGLPPTSFWASETLLKHRKVPFFFAYSPSVFPKPAEWPDWLHVTGYCFLDRPADWQPDATLVEFLAAGPPPVFVGFSSLSNHKIESMTSLVVESLALSQQRGILAAGWSDFGKIGALPDNILAVDTVPHDWLFPRVSAVVHHGGAGTTAAAFRAGIPNIIIPFGLDQPFWSWRTQVLGAGPDGIPPKRLTATRLAHAIHEAVHNTEMRARAATLSERICSEDGVARAVDLFHHYISSYRETE